MKRAALGLLLLVVTASCGGREGTGQASSNVSEQPAASMGNATAECVMRYPARQPFDVGDVAVPAAPGMMGPTSDPSVDPIVEECRANDGLHCDPEGFISKEAAICISQTWEPAEVGSWSAQLLFRIDEAVARVQWLVIAVGPQGADCCGPSWSFWIDATSAETLRHSGPLQACCPEP
jgi:hypothetical protein